MKPERLLIIADDVTGAADCISHCAKYQGQGTLFVDKASRQLPLGVVAVSTNSRHLSPAGSATKVEQCVSHFTCGAETIWFKKIDSLLRGNAGAEIKALLKATTDCHGALICSALPVYGRSVRDGYLIAEQTSAKSHFVPGIIAAQTDGAVESISLSVVRGAEEKFRIAIETAFAAGNQFVSLDAETDDDLKRIVAIGTTLHRPPLFCGSAGLLGALAPSVFPRSGNVTAEKVFETKPKILAVIGSGTAAAHRQIDRLRNSGECAVQEIDLDPGASTPVVSGSVDLLIHLPFPANDVSLDGDFPRTVAAKLIEAALRRIELQRPDVIIAAGGDIAEYLLAARGVDSLTLRANILPGMPLLSGPNEMYLLKSGSHGDDYALVEILSRLRTKAELP